jgi:hypothetical protein
MGAEASNEAAAMNTILLKALKQIIETGIKNKKKEDKNKNP